MKKKFLVFTLCFTLIFSSLNYKKSYADGGIISLPMIATISALAVGSNIIINSGDDLYDLGRIFYDYIDRHNDLTWATVQSVFSSSVALQSNKLVSVNSDFLDIVKGFFDNTFDKNIDISFNDVGIPIGYENAFYVDTSGKDHLDFKVGLISFEGSYVTSRNYYDYYDITMTLNDNVYTKSEAGFGSEFTYYWIVPGSNRLAYTANSKPTSNSYHGSYILDKIFSHSLSVGVFPYNGGYTWDNVESKKENESVSLPIPGNLEQLVGQGSTDFWGNTNDLLGEGGLSLPGVDSPSIGVDISVNTFPGVDSLPGVDSPSVPNDGIWVTIKDFIIGFVVPGDTYWTDTWGGLYNNFTNSFPMVDMDGFNDLVTGEKKFPNIDIDIMGVNGRVVNGDVINSIVDWLRPIIAGFMMLCLILFNYRKIYKLIRNSEPFGGIAPGTSDFKTGISEYNKEPVIKAVDMASDYRAWKENGGK